MNRPDRAADIEFDIERTRDEMADTLQAIERKFSPNRLMDEVMQTMNATLTQSRVADVVRDNPLPLALVGLGLGWLALSSLRGERPLVGDEESGEAGYSGGIADAMEEAGEWAGYGAGGGNGGARHAIDQAREGVGDLADSVQDSVRAVGEAARQRTRGLRHRVTRASRQVTSQASDLFDDHPLAVGLVAVAAGLAIGLAIPRGRREAEVIGQTGAQLLGQARQTGREALRKASRVVQRVTDTGAEEASPTTH